MAKRRLGRGLDSLISPTTAQPAAGAQEIELALINLNPHQPRRDMDAEALEGLAESIRQAGVLQPVMVRRQGEMYELVVGERRLRAANMAGLDKIPAVVREVPDEQMLELALIENVQREDLNPIEKARAMRRLIEELKLTQEQVGQKLGLERPTIANSLRLLELPDEIQEMVSRGTLSAGHARALLALDDDAQRLALARKVVKTGLSVRETERLAASLGAKRGRTRSKVSPQIKHLERTLQEALGARAEIRSRGNRGRIILHFANADEFERLFEIMTGTKGGSG